MIEYRALVAALVATTALACGGTRTRTSTVDVGGASLSELGLEALERDLEATVLENYGQLSLGNIDAYFDGLSDSGEITLIGVTPGDVYIGSDTARARRDRRLYPQREPRLLSKDLTVRVSRDGSMGWIYDEISYRVRYMGREAAIPLRHTALFARSFERWVLVSEHISYALPDDQVVALASGGSLRHPRGIRTNANGHPKLATALVSLVGRMHNINGTNRRKSIPMADDAIVLLPEPADESTGYGVGQQPSMVNHYGDKTVVAVKAFRLSVSESGQVAWLTANLTIRTTQNDDALSFGLRGTYVFERAANKQWQLVQGHISAPFLEAQISERAFGA